MSMGRSSDHQFPSPPYIMDTEMKISFETVETNILLSTVPQILSAVSSYFAC